MKQLHSSITFEVQPDETVPLRVDRGVALTSADRRLWVTRSADSADYWVAPGETLALRPGEVLWISAEGNHSARVTITQMPRCVQRVVTWLANYFGKIGVSGGWLSV
jgi:hypothetical protein